MLLVENLERDFQRSAALMSQDGGEPDENDGDRERDDKKEEIVHGAASSMQPFS